MTAPLGGQRRDDATSPDFGADFSDDPLFPNAGRAATLEAEPPPTRPESFRSAPPSGRPNWRAPTPTPARPNSARPTPLPKQPKGRWLVGSFLLALVALAGQTVWSTFLRYSAYGHVTGRVIRVSPHCEGFLQSLAVREGDLVRQGQLLASIENVELQKQLDRLSDDLRLAQANLNAGVAELRLQSLLRGDQSQKALAEHFQVWGELLQERAELAKQEADLQRLVGLAERGRTAPAELEAAQFAVDGRRAKVEKLTSAVEELKKRADLATDTGDAASAQLQPHFTRIESLQSELARWRKQLQQSEILSPVNGRVIKQHRFTGEYADVSDPVFELVEDGSVEVVIFLPQRLAKSLQLGDEVELTLEPHRLPLPSKVIRFDDRLETVPGSLERYYRKNEKLLPVHLQPNSDAATDLPLRLNSEVRLPVRWTNLKSQF